MNKLVFLLLLLPIVGCTTLSKEGCEQLSLQLEKKGYIAAINGLRGKNTSDRNEIYCEKKYGTTFEFERFKTGYIAGLRKFCTPDNGYAFGKAGGVYEGTCPEEVEKAFLEKYQSGQIQYTARKVKSMDDRLEALEQENRNKAYRIQELEDELKRKSNP